MKLHIQAGAQQGADVAPQVTVKAPGVTVYTDGKNQVLQIPTSHNEMLALLARRRQIGAQLESVTERRDGLIEQLRVAPVEGQAGLKAQLSVLDERILQLENDLGQVGREIAAASPELMSMAYEPSNPPSEGAFDDGMGAGAAIMFVFMSTVFFFWRRRWGKKRRSAPVLPSADSERLQRLENGMEAMAIEIERISEGQRFVTKLMSESRAPESLPR
ncbi:MAG TPA: hypothetical protein VJ840_04545 [Gemmatimonadaceae bacterium]|nr:hypothetical protein [Gemmatimonadaceae bacterium]